MFGVPFKQQFIITVRNTEVYIAQRDLDSCRLPIQMSLAATKPKQCVEVFCTSSLITCNGICCYTRNGVGLFCWARDGSPASFHAAVTCLFASSDRFWKTHAILHPSPATSSNMLHKNIFSLNCAYATTRNSLLVLVKRICLLI